MEFRQGPEHGLHPGGQLHLLEQGADLGARLALEHVEQGIFELPGQPRLTHESAIDPHMAKIEMDIRDPHLLQGLQHQAYDLDIASRTLVPVELGTDLHGAA